MDEIVTIDALVARDKDGELRLYKRQPRKNYGLGIFIPTDIPEHSVKMRKVNDFPSVTFENSPKKVKVTIELEEE